MTLVVLYLVVRYGNRYRRVFADYFTLNYAWLVAFVGIWMSVQHPGTDLEHGGVGRQHVTE